MNTEKNIVKNTYNDMRNGVRNLKKSCGNMRGELAVKCFTRTNEFEDELIEIFEDEVEY